MPNHKILEVCVDSLASALQAQAGGATRLELCCALVAGGLTPDPALLAQVRDRVDIPVRCLVRCRPGDFLYTPDELDLMCAQIAGLVEAGASGVVIGALTAAGQLDVDATARLRDAAAGLPCTLHRCIDVSNDALACYTAAANLGIDCILTSGQAPSAIEGAECLRALVALRDAQGGPEVMAGAGVSADAIASLKASVDGLVAFHMSGKVDVDSGMTFRRQGVPMGLPGLDEWHVPVTSAERVRAAASQLGLD